MPGTELMCVLAHAECFCDWRSQKLFLFMPVCVFIKASVAFVFLHGEGGRASQWLILQRSGQDPRGFALQHRRRYDKDAVRGDC